NFFTSTTARSQWREPASVSLDGNSARDFYRTRAFGGMNGYTLFSAPGALLLFLIHLAVIARVILRPHREPASRIAWIVMIITLPVLGMVSYLLLGETNIGRRRVRRMREMLAGMPSVADAPGADAPALQAEIPERYSHLFR